jgi:hypothetical protein
LLKLSQVIFSQTKYNADSGWNGIVGERQPRNLLERFFVKLPAHGSRPYLQFERIIQRLHDSLTVLHLATFTKSAQLWGQESEPEEDRRGNALGHTLFKAAVSQLDQ